MKVLLLSLVGSILLLPVSARAHTHLLRSSPAENAVLAKPPPSATLEFAEPVTLTALKLESADGIKPVVRLPPQKPATEVAVALPALSPGRYKLGWRAVGRDGHMMSGDIHFTVGAKGG